MHVQEVALVVHELHLHALNVDGAEVDALVGLQGGTELNVGLAGGHGVCFDGDQREHVGGGGARVAAQGGGTAPLVDCVDGVELRLRELAGGGLDVRGVARRVAVAGKAGGKIGRQAEPRVGGGNGDQPLVQVVLVVVVQHQDEVLGAVRVGHRLGHECRPRLQRVRQLVGHGRGLIGAAEAHEPAEVGIQLGRGEGVVDVGRD